MFQKLLWHKLWKFIEHSFAKIEIQNFSKKGDYFEIHIHKHFLGYSNFVIWLAKIQDWSVRWSDSWVWLCDDCQKIPLYFELEGVYKLLKLKNAIEESNIYLGLTKRLLCSAPPCMVHTEDPCVELLLMIK